MNVTCEEAICESDGASEWIWLEAMRRLETAIVTMADHELKEELNSENSVAEYPYLSVPFYVFISNLFMLGSCHT